MTPEQLANIQARADAATKGPWGVSYYGTGGGPPEGCEVMNKNGSLDMGTALPDAAFIANARTDVPALLALVREQAIHLEGLRTDMQDAMAAAWDEGRLAGSGLSVVSALLRPNPYHAAPSVAVSAA